jgi:hypothetical protein
MGRALAKDGQDRVPKWSDGQALMPLDEQEVHHVSRSRRAAAPVRPGVRVQLLGNLTFQRNQQHVDRAEPELRQEPRTLPRLGIPRLGGRSSHVHLQRLERPAGERTLQPVPNGQTQSGIAQLLAAGYGEIEVISDVFGRRPLQIDARGRSTLHVIRIQVDRHACTIAEPGFESEPTLHSPPAGCDPAQPHHQPLESGLAPKDEGRHVEAAGAVA